MAAAMAAAVFAVLLPLAWHASGVDGVDRWIVVANPSAHRTLFDLGAAGSFVGSGMVVAAVAILAGMYLWLRSRRPWLGLAVVMAAGGTGALQLAAKYVIQRPRPGSASVSGESGYTFPSGHTAGATALAVGLVVLALHGPWSVRLTRQGRRGVLIVAVVYAAGVAISRVLVGAHYLTDTIAGLAFGVVVSTLTFATALRREAAGTHPLRGVEH
jgi:membrane-associated phospholipid phosphatase